MSRMPEVGDVVDDVFRVESVLDEGSFGSVYRVCDTLEDRTLALKVQKAGSENPEEVRARFEREARLIHQLRHEHIVDLLYYGETDPGLPYMAMEFLVGTNLERLIEHGFEFDIDQIKRIALETLSALEAAHEVGIVHRDMKPGNIFLAEDGKRGHVKVLDFGFAKAVDNPQPRYVTHNQRLIGTPAYMAPEMVDKENLGPHTDLYGLGLILGEMIAGEKLVPIENPINVIKFQKSDAPVDLPEQVENSPFAEVVRDAVRKDIGARYQTADAMMKDLLQIERAETIADLQTDADVERKTTAPFGHDAIVQEELPESPSDGDASAAGASGDGRITSEIADVDGRAERPPDEDEDDFSSQSAGTTSTTTWFVVGGLGVLVALGLAWLAFF